MGHAPSSSCRSLQKAGRLPNDRGTSGTVLVATGTRWGRAVSDAEERCRRRSVRHAGSDERGLRAPVLGQPPRDRVGVRRSQPTRSARSRLGRDTPLLEQRPDRRVAAPERVVERPHIPPWSHATESGRGTAPRSPVAIRVITSTRRKRAAGTLSRAQQPRRQHWPRHEPPQLFCGRKARRSVARAPMADRPARPAMGREAYQLEYL